MTLPAAAAAATTGRWISQSSAQHNLGLLRPGELAALRRSGTVRYVEAGTVVATAGSPATHVMAVGDGELELMARHDAGRVARSAHRLTLHLPVDWPWEPCWQRLQTAAHGPPLAGGPIHPAHPARPRNHGKTGADR